MKTLGEKIKEAREDAGLTQDGLAEQLHIDKNTVWRWEKNKRHPHYRKLQQIAHVLEINLAELVAETDYITPKNYLIDTMNNSGTANVANQMDTPPPEVISISVGDIRMEFPKGTPADVIGRAIESARKGSESTEA
jgi:transcriptional regulator with XRE-family HTH domain